MPEETRVLIVEDEAAISEAIRYNLEREGFACTVASDGLTGLALAKSQQPHLIILDLMLPGMSGVDVCREIRLHGRTPIIMVSARDSETDKVLGLELGADDYITKPFSTRELIARVRTVLRRSDSSTEASTEVLTVGPVELDADRHEVRILGEIVAMPLREFILLEQLMRRAGRLCTRDMLIANVWGPDYFGDTRTLDVHVKRLRAKIEADARKPRHLLTVRGVGYRFEP